jgi:UDP-N-acetylmuramoyl-L-alanyl-D-glutamate--2,6-diaminopimelate ligase
MQLRDLLNGVEVRWLTGDAWVAGLHYDSRKIEPGWAFVAIEGEQVDGNRFVPAALERGAVAILSEREPSREFQKAGAGKHEIGWAQVANGRRALATASANWFRRPADELRLVAITGTNGKTTTSFICENILKQAGTTSSLIGTVEYHIGEKVLPSPHTTPESYDLQQLFRQMREAHCTAAVMEVSSHALAMERVWGCSFETAVFTNLTQDHLDFHKTFDAYRAAKKRLFEGTGGRPPANAVINADDPSSPEMVRDFRGRIITYGFSAAADLRGSRLENTPGGLRFQLEAREGWSVAIQSPLLGRVNALNLLAAIGTGLSLKLDRDTVLAAAQKVQRVHGRFERVFEGQPFTVVVDYAHTHDALNNVLALARELVSGRNGSPPGRVITLFGCGGDRDRGKRPLMGEAAGCASDIVVLTSDNPRSEDPQAIINDALRGLQRTPARQIVEPERRLAIRKAITEARTGDIVVLAGKGHETYQIIGPNKLPFDDAEEARSALRDLGFGHGKAPNPQR